MLPYLFCISMLPATSSLYPHTRSVSIASAFEKPISVIFFTFTSNSSFDIFGFLAFSTYPSDKN